MSGGNTALIMGNPQNAEALCFEAIGLLREVDDQWSLAWGLNSLGHASLQLGKLEQARASFEECIAVARNIGNPGATISTLLGIAILATTRFQNQAHTKEPDPGLINAVRLLGAIPALNQSVHMVFWLGWWSEVHERAVLQARRVMDDATWEKTFAEGAALTMQQAAAIALQEVQSK